MSDHQVLTSEAHRELRVRTERGAEFGDAVMSCLVVPNEFRQVQNEYPILFRAKPERDGFVAVALFGFESGENLFLEDGRWDARHLPLAMRIQPFLIGKAPGGTGDGQVHIDMASPRIGDGVRVFDPDGRATPHLEAVAEDLGALDAGYAASAGFFDALRRHRLLEPLTLEITLNDGSTHRLVGYHVIDEERLQSLDAAALAELNAADHLLPVFMALASLANLGALIARKNRRTSGG